MQEVPVWKIIRKFIGQDLRYVSLPVALNEPLTLLQKICENLVLSGAKLYDRAAETDDPVMRSALAVVALSVFASNSKYRKKKPFNPMLGETFEMVTENYRYLAEKVMHTPDQIVCYALEGKNYTVQSFQKAKPQFHANGIRGALEIKMSGTHDFYFKKYDENISATKQGIFIKNIIFGGLYVDIDDTIESINHKTGERIMMKFVP